MGSLLHHDEILGAIVGSVVITVMYVLVSMQPTAQLALHDDPVLLLDFPIDENPDIAMHIYSPATLPIRVS